MRIAISLVSVALNAALSVSAIAQQQSAGDRPDGEIQPTTVVQLSESGLKAFYMRCSRAAMRQALSGAEIARCSVAYEMLLKSTFRGDFLALLAWSRSQPATERE